MTTPEGLDLANVLTTTNIIWKNVTVLTGIGKGNASSATRSLNRLLWSSFRGSIERAEGSFPFAWRHFVDIGTHYFEMRLSGQRPKGFVVMGKTMIKVTDPSRRTRRTALQP